MHAVKVFGFSEIRPIGSAGPSPGISDFEHHVARALTEVRKLNLQDQMCDPMGNLPSDHVVEAACRTLSDVLDLVEEQGNIQQILHFRQRVEKELAKLQSKDWVIEKCRDNDGWYFRIEAPV